jgi:uncharacterized protein (DUF2249 family)
MNEIQNTTTSSVDEVFDGREIPCRVKHGLILQRCTQLATGTSFILVNDHDPVPLRYQIQAEHPEQFEWSYIERGPEVFRVRIRRIAAG